MEGGYLIIFLGGLCNI